MNRRDCLGLAAALALPSVVAVPSAHAGSATAAAADAEHAAGSPLSEEKEQPEALEI